MKREVGEIKKHRAGLSGSWDVGSDGQVRRLGFSACMTGAAIKCDTEQRTWGLADRSSDLTTLYRERQGCGKASSELRTRGRKKDKILQILPCTVKSD